MPENLNTSQKRKQGELSQPELTKQEIESLRSDKQETHKRIEELWEKEDPKVKEKMLKALQGPNRKP